MGWESCGKHIKQCKIKGKLGIEKKSVQNTWSLFLQNPAIQSPLSTSTFSSLKLNIWFWLQTTELWYLTSSYGTVHHTGRFSYDQWFLVGENDQKNRANCILNHMDAPDDVLGSREGKCIPTSKHFTKEGALPHVRSFCHGAFRSWVRSLLRHLLTLQLWATYLTSLRSYFFNLNIKLDWTVVYDKIQLEILIQTCLLFKSRLLFVMNLIKVHLQELMAMNQTTASWWIWRGKNPSK